MCIVFTYRRRACIFQAYKEKCVRRFAKFFLRIRRFPHLSAYICYVKWWFLRPPLAHTHKKWPFSMRICKFYMRRIDLLAGSMRPVKIFYGGASPSASPNWRLFAPTWKYSSPPPSGILLLTLASRGLEEPAHALRGLEEPFFQLCCCVSFGYGGK